MQDDARVGRGMNLWTGRYAEGVPSDKGVTQI